MNKYIKTLKWISIILLFFSIIPLIVVSFCVYPQADDFSFSQTTYHVWNDTHSILSLIIEAIKTCYRYWWDWQGSYFSCFLMSLQPALFNEKLYHIVPILLLGFLFVALLYFNSSIFTKILYLDNNLVILITNIEFLVIIENIINQAEAFFWYNSGIHYIGILCIALIYYGYLLSLPSKKQPKLKYVFQQSLACILAFMIAGGNNLVVLAGLIINISIIILLFIHDIYQYKNIIFSPNMQKILPSSIILIAGSMLNILSIGNKERLAYIGGAKYSVIHTIFKSFNTGLKNIGNWFNFTIFLYLVFIIIFSYIIYEETKDKLRNITIAIPIFITFYSYCLFSALFSPEIYTFGNATTERTLNVIFIIYILCLTLDLFIWSFYLFQRQFKFITQFILLITNFRKKIFIVFFPASFLIILMMVIVNPTRFLTTSAMYYYYKGETIACKNTIEYNIDLLHNEDLKIVYLRKLPYKPKILFSDEIEEWKSGAVFYYQKDSINWEE